MTFQKGNIPWNKGREFSKEHKRRLSRTRKTKIGIKAPFFGKHHTEEAKKKISRSGENHPYWKGGQRIGKGYLYIWKPKHPNADGCGYVASHRLIAEKVLGRFLKRDEVVHHVNGNPLDNRNCNLLISSNSYHMWLHSEMRRLNLGVK